MSLTFAVPAGRAAQSPPEHRGLDRDGVRLLVARPGHLGHLHFRDLPKVLDAGDLLVVNTSGTLAAAVSGRVATLRAPVHVAGTLDDGSWVVEVRLPDGSGPDLSLRTGLTLDLDGGAQAQLLAAHPDPARWPSRLWRARVTGADTLPEYLTRHGRPIRYGYLDAPYPIAAYQSVYAGEPGSAEMVSAGRPFSDRVLVELISRGVTIAALTLHAGVSSPELHEPPAPERYHLPQDTARLVNSARRAGRRVVAVGTTVVRALETSVTTWGEVRGGSGWTDLVLDGAHRTRAVDGLVTGLHDADASHQVLLRAVAGAQLVDSAYAAALAEDYLWHEFGDSMVFLPS